MTTSTKKKVQRGKRYSTEEKNKVVSFVADYNATNGRGGQSAASSKFGISQLTIASWLKKAGLGSTTTGNSPKGGIQKKLNTMLKLGQDIEKLERELNAKRSQFESLKSAL